MLAAGILAVFFKTKASQRRLPLELTLRDEKEPSLLPQNVARNRPACRDDMGGHPADGIDVPTSVC